jgi:hypothetical protein
LGRIFRPSLLQRWEREGLRPAHTLFVGQLVGQAYGVASEAQEARGIILFCPSFFALRAKNEGQLKEEVPERSPQAKRRLPKEQV